MAKDPSPRADALRAQREARYGHLQATVGPTDAEAELVKKMAADKAVLARRRDKAGAEAPKVKQPVDRPKKGKKT